MSALVRWSLRRKLATLGIVLPLLLVLVLFILYFAQSKRKVVEAFVNKSRAICLTAESTREDMDDKWELGLFTPAMIRQWAEAGEMDKVMAAIPVVSAWRAAMAKAEQGGYIFKVPKFEPRNPANEPDALEAEVINLIKDKNLDEYYVIDREQNAVRYFLPVRLGQSCMPCHGNPNRSQQLWGNDQGLDPTGARMENWEVGSIHGAFEVIQSLDDADRELTASLGLGALVAVIALTAMAALFVGTVIRTIERPITVVTEGLYEGSEQVSRASDQVASSSQSMAEGATESASSLEQTSASLEQMASMTRQNADSAEQANVMASDMRQSAERGREAMERMRTAISDIKTASDETASILKSIDEIAFQTNLLALNAAVEAARAGEAGKGFAVVAEEVRSLAQRSAEAARSTNDLTQRSQTSAENGVKVSEDVYNILGEIVEAVAKVSQLVGEVAAASKEQAQGIDQINGAVGQLDQVTQSNAASSEEAAAASEELSAQAQELNQIVASLVEIVRGQRETSD